MAKQINIFMENRPGRLESIAAVLAEHDISIRAFSIQDRGEFGLIKLLVDKPKQCHLVLADKGIACALKDVIAVKVPDCPDNLYKLTKILTEMNVNIVDAYGFILEPEKAGVYCLEVREQDKRFADLESMLREGGFEIICDQHLYEM